MTYTIVRMARNGAPGFICAGKREPFVSSDLVNEPGPLFFDFGATEEEARAKVLAEMGALQ